MLNVTTESQFCFPSKMWFSFVLQIYSVMKVFQFQTTEIRQAEINCTEKGNIMGDMQTCNQIYPKNITTQIELFQQQAKIIEVFPIWGYLPLTDWAKHMQISSFCTTHDYKVRIISSWIHLIWKHKYPETVKICVNLNLKSNKSDSKRW